MSSVNIERHNQLITKYCIPNMGSYSAVGGELSPILERLDTNRALSAEDKQWIRDKGLFDLNEFIKKLELTDITQAQVLAAVNKLNHRPRKVLGYKSPHEVFFGVDMCYT